MVYLSTDDRETALKYPVPDRKPGRELVFFRQDIGEIGKIQELLSFYLGHQLPQLNGSECMLVVDEVLSNAIIASYCRNPGPDREVLVAQWERRPPEPGDDPDAGERFVFQVIDFGGGFDTEQVGRDLPRTNSSDYIREVIRYQENHRVRLMQNGREITHNCTGRGLAIIAEFCTSFELVFFDQDWNTYPQYRPGTLGTIFTCHFQL